MTKRNYTYKERFTQRELKQLLHYCPATGDFTWKLRKFPDLICGCSSHGVNIFNSTWANGPAGYVSPSGYVLIGLSASRHRAHRLAVLYMTGHWPAEEVDHINHNRADNRWKNLRECTHVENSKNGSLKSNNTSGVQGVIWDASRGAWQARVTLLGRGKLLGRFQNFDDAVAARKAAEIKYGFHRNHGQQATAHAVDR